MQQCLYFGKRNTSNCLFIPISNFFEMNTYYLKHILKIKGRKEVYLCRGKEERQNRKANPPHQSMILQKE